MKILARLLLLSLLALQLPLLAADKKFVVMIAGKQSHGPGAHEHNAGVLLLAKCLREGASDLIEVKTHLNGEWPADDVIARADTILIYADGYSFHPAVQKERLSQLAKEMKRGCGFVTLHWATEVLKDKGGAEFLEWMGGYCEPFWSVNPHWQADFTKLPVHPIANGVRPFTTHDEWYFHMRFKDGMKSVAPILSAIPPVSLKLPDGMRSGNAHVRQEVADRLPQHVSWATERADGGRGFGFTGGHNHKNWGNDDQRKVVLNAILWTAKAPVPAIGVQSKVTPEELLANLDPKGKK